MKKTWRMIAVSLSHPQTDFMEVWAKPNSEVTTEQPLLTRDEALEIVAAWNRYNEWWAYGLLDDDNWQPEFFDFDKLRSTK